MPLIQCEECAASVSDRANKCPECGYPLGRAHPGAGGATTAPVDRGSAPTTSGSRRFQLISIVSVLLGAGAVWVAVHTSSLHRREVATQSPASGVQTKNAPPLAPSDAARTAVALSPPPAPTPAPLIDTPGAISASAAKAVAISAPRPEYPYEARSRRITGGGVCLLIVDKQSGVVTNATMVQSTGNPILDNSSVSAFRRWRFKPGAVDKVRMPIAFTMAGAQY